MENVLEEWCERHETDEEVFAGDGYRIDHRIYIETNGDIIHERKVFKFDTWEMGYELASTEQIVLQKGSK